MKLIKIADQLINDILSFRNLGNCFTTLKIIVPSKRMEEWLKKYWLKTQTKALMNIKFETFTDFLQKSIVGANSKFLVDKSTLVLAIINKLISNWKPADNDNNFERSREYYFKNGKFDEEKLLGFAQELAKVFLASTTGTKLLYPWEKELFSQIDKELDEQKLGILDINRSQKLKIAAEPQYFFGFTYLKPVHKSLLKQYLHDNSNAKMYSIIDIFEEEKVALEKLREENPKPILLGALSASSEIREIEYVHSKICSLLLAEPDLNHNDFLIVTPDISKYKNVINAVFKQNNIDFPSIPFAIKGSSKEDTDESNFIELMLCVLNKKEYSRKDVAGVILNPTVQKVRSISTNEAAVILQTILNLNVYRNRDMSKDWEYLKNRLLLSKLIDSSFDENPAVLEQNEFLSYSNIGITDEIISKVIAIIDDLDDWISIGNKYLGHVITNAAAAEIKEYFDKFLSFKDEEDDVETNLAYKRVLKIYNAQKNFTNLNLSINNLLTLWREAAKTTVTVSGDLITGGVNCVEFDPACILSAKHVFFVGANANALPVFETPSELEYDSDFIKKQIENELNVYRLGFLLQILNTESKCYLSYVDLDAATDEKLFITGLADELFKKDEDGKLIFNKIKVILDENRGWEELFTRREFENRVYYDGLISKNTTSEVKVHTDISNVINVPIKVSTKQMADFLSEPLKWKLENQFGSEDDSSDLINDEFESFRIDAINRSKVYKEIFKEILSDGDISKIEKTTILENSIPKFYENSDKLEVDALVNKVKKHKQTLDEGNLSNLIKVKNDDIPFPLNENKWILTSKLDVYKQVDDDKITYFELRYPKSTKSMGWSEYLVSYVEALADVVRENLDETQIEIVRFLHDTPKKQSFVVSASQAKELLTTIYQAMIDFSENYYIDIDSGEKTNNYFEILENVESKWEYFKLGKMVDKDTQLGYDEEKVKEFHEKIDLFKNLVLYTHAKED